MVPEVEEIASAPAALMAEESETGKEPIENEDQESSKKSETGVVPYYKLFSFADSLDYVLMVVGGVAAVASGSLAAFRSVLLGRMINAFGRNHDVVHEVTKVALVFLYVGFADGLASFLQVACWSATGERQAARIRNLYLKSILRQEIAFFDKETNTGEVIEKISGDAFLIQDAMGEKAGKFIFLMSAFFGGFTVAFVMGWQLALVMLSTIPPTAVCAAMMAIALTRMAARGQTAYSEAAITVEQTIGSIRTVASFTGEKQAVNKYDKSLEKAYKTSVLEGLAAGLGMGSTHGIMQCGYGLGIWFGSLMIQKKDYSGSDVIVVIISIVFGAASLGQASPCTSAFAAGQAAAFKIFNTINRKPVIDAYDFTGKLPDDIRGDIELRDIYFSYPSRPTEQIFNGLSLFIPSGATVALVGESGSGKSTVISLIERFYDPQAGEVLVDGINLKEFQLKWIRRKIGLVSQEPILFACSIRDNIAYGKDHATLQEIRAAIELANASKFIDNLPQGLDTMVGEHGTQLSGGQKQRIAIARAILKDPRILLLDEATSALDVESERLVQEALDRVMADRTTVIVAHRLTTVRKADMITVIHQGSIVEKGSHSELLEDPNGAYTQLIRLQEASQHQDIDQHMPPDQDSLSASLDRISSQRSSSQKFSVRGGRQRSLSDSLSVAVGLGTQESMLQKPDPKEPSRKHPEVPVTRLAYLNKPELPLILLGVIGAIFNGLIFPLFAIIFSGAIHAFYETSSKRRKDSRFWSLMFVVLGLVTLVSYPVRTFFFGLSGSKLVRRVRLMSFEKVVHMEIGWFDKSENSSGAVGARLSADAAAVRSLVGDTLAVIVQNAASVTAGVVIAFVACWQLALVVVATFPMMCLSGWLEMKFMKGFSANAKMMYEEASQVASEAIGSIRTVVSFTAEEKVMEVYKKKCEGPVNGSIRQGLISGISFGFSSFLLYISYVICFYAGARLVEDGKTTFGDVFRAFFAISTLAIGLSQSGTMAPDASKAKSATASVFAILDRKSTIDSSDDSGMTIQAVTGNIEFQHVSFRYPTRPDVQVFRDFCLNVQSGKTVALVGESGSGKSTVVSLLQRFYDSDSGQILLDGIDIRKLQLRWLRQQMGLVSQEPVLFKDTIRANIAYGKGGEATEAEILAAAEASNAHQFISGLHQGYDTTVGERGVQLSGGQKQRIAIARAIVKEPKILLLDEATSALDAESERVVQDALDRVMVNRTTVVIAHRLSTIKGADLIAVVRNGVIIEEGKHDELLNIKNGAYASLVALHLH